MPFARKSGPEPVNRTKFIFQFPIHHHLIVSTDNRILSIDTNGVHLILDKLGGVLAVRKAKDGSGNFAISDGQVVILHNTRNANIKTYKVHAAKVRIITIVMPLSELKYIRVNIDYSNSPMISKTYILLQACIIPYFASRLVEKGS